MILVKRLVAKKQRQRLRKMNPKFPLHLQKIYGKIESGIPEDFEGAKFLAKEDQFAFEIFAVEACHPGMVANKSQRRDKGIDGRGKLLFPVQQKGKKKQMVLAQVKAKKKVSPDDVRGFATVIRDTPGAVAGVFNHRA